MHFQTHMIVKLIPQTNTHKVQIKYRNKRENDRFHKVAFKNPINSFLISTSI